MAKQSNKKTTKVGATKKTTGTKKKTTSTTKKASTSKKTTASSKSSGTAKSTATKKKSAAKSTAKKTSVAKTTTAKKGRTTTKASTKTTAKKTATSKKKAPTKKAATSKATAAKKNTAKKKTTTTKKTSKAVFNRMKSGKDYSKDTVLKVWNKGREIAKLDSSIWRKDCYKRLMKFEEYGNSSSKFGWEIDHIKPSAEGGSDHLNNLQPLQWRNNRAKENNYPWTSEEHSDALRAMKEKESKK
jgi:hypothetical protein